MTDHDAGPIAAVEQDQPVRSVTVGLYSFPKSGNTWLRAIMAAITDMPKDPSTLHTYLTDTHYGTELRPWFFRRRNWHFYKSHSKVLLRTYMGEPLHTNKVIYIHRHPLDVFVSYLNFVSDNGGSGKVNHFGFPMTRVEDMTPEQMEQMFQLFLDRGTIFPRNTLYGSVFASVRNFRRLQSNGKPVLILRYEDLQDDFGAQIDRICDFISIRRVDVSKVFSTADEATQKDGRFFWKRQKDTYRSFLSPEQIDRFRAKYRTELEEMGYGDD